MNYTSLDSKNLPLFIRVIMSLATFIRLLYIAEFIVSIVFVGLYDSGLSNYPEEERSDHYCSSCFYSYLSAIILSGLTILLDIFFMTNPIGAYVRNHYGGGIDASDKKNLKAVSELNATGMSTSAKCFGFGCCSGIGTIYQINACKEMVRSEDSACGKCGNYMCLSVYPFPWTVSWIRKFGYGGAVIIGFMVTVIYTLIVAVPTVFIILCYTNKTYCMIQSSSSVSELFAAP